MTNELSNTSNSSNGAEYSAEDHSNTRTPHGENRHDTNKVLGEADAYVVSRALDWIPLQRPHRSFPPLTRLVAIPQIQPNTLRSGPMPFYRAYAPDLSNHAVTIEEFVAFLDNLAVVQAPAVPFKVLQLASTGVGFVPHHWAQAASAGIGVVAGAGSATVSAARSKLYMKGVNEHYFMPRGLKATILNDEQLRFLTQESHLSHPLASVCSSLHVLTVAERRIKALENQIAALSFDVPSPEEQAGILDKLSAKQVQATIKKAQENAIKQARKKHEFEEQDERLQQQTSGSHNHSANASSCARVAALGDLHNDTKARELALELQQINFKAERKMLKEHDHEKRERIIAKTRKKIDKKKEKIEKSERKEKQESLNFSKKAHKEEEKAVKDAARLKWVVIENA